MNDAHLERFARDFAPGHVLFEEGQRGDFMYVVQSGEVLLTSNVCAVPLLTEIATDIAFGETNCG